MSYVLTTAARTSRLPLDPCTKLLLIFVMNGLVLGTANTLWAVVGFAISVLLLLTAAPLRWTIGYVAVVVVAVAAYGLLPQALPTGVGLTLSLIGFWVAKFSVAVGLGAYFVFSTSVSQLTASLRRSRVPYVIVVPIAVMLRFIPTVARELRAIVDAMRLRGVVPSAGSIVFHPVRTSEYVLVPLLASSTRLADDLAASAMVRGLGSSPRPTFIVPLRFSAVDALVIGGVAVMLAVQFAGWMPTGALGL